MEEYNLSEYVKRLMQHFDNGNRGISISTNNDPYYDEIKNIIDVNNDFFAKEAEVHNAVVYSITKEYELNIEYLYNFLLMCEALLQNEKPIINRFNETKLRELKNENIVNYKENRGRFDDIEVLNFTRLEDEYFNMRYEVDSPININVKTNNTNNKNNNSNIQINCNINENDINDIVQAIQMLIAMNSSVPEYLKDALADNREDKNKLQETLMEFSKWLISSGEASQINVSVSILTNIALQANTQFNS